MIFFQTLTNSWYSCSGTLFDAYPFLTAGPCTLAIGTDLERVGFPLQFSRRYWKLLTKPLKAAMLVLTSHAGFPSSIGSD